MSRHLIVPVVEGHGEVEAVPLLVRRIYAELLPDVTVVVNHPIRVKSGSFVSDELYFRRYVAMAAAKAAQGNGLVLILLDCEDDCPADLGPKLLAGAKSVRPDVPSMVVLAHREYETWFLAAAESLDMGLAPPDNPEAIRGAKEWLTRRMAVPYDPIIHQASFTSKFDLRQAQRIPSFARLVRKVTCGNLPSMSGQN